MAYSVLCSVGPQAQFTVLHETPDWLAVDKPPGVLVHPTKPGGPRTLWESLCDLLAFELVNGGRVSILTRLDRETSGVVLVAKNLPAARNLSLDLAAGKIKKRYLALVFGWPEVARWTVDAPILRLGEVEPFRVWLKRGAHPAGAPATTHFRTLHKFFARGATKISLVEAVPLTGRTHQIRVHLAHSGFPIVGDKLYARGDNWYLRFIESGWTEEMERSLLLSRHALHASGLEFSFGGSDYEVRSPLPSDFQTFAADDESEFGFASGSRIRHD